MGGRASGVIPTRRQRLRRQAAWAAVWFATLAALAIAGCRSAEQLFFYPSGAIVTTPDRNGYAWEDVRFQSRDGTELNGWFIRARGEPAGTVIHFHGNAENMSTHYSFVSWLPASGFNLFVFDYRGYGRSEGTPSLAGVVDDSAAAIEHVRARTDLGPRRIVIFGQSLGAASAVSALGQAGTAQVCGVAIESGFSSSAEVAGDAASGLGRLLIPDRIRPVDSIGSLSPVPVLIIHGTADRVVDYRHSETLLAAAGDPKERWTVPGGRHLEGLGHLQPKLLERFREWVANPPPG